jgi:CxxC motif-containing protein
MNTELIKVYKSLEDLPQTKEVKQIKKNIEVSLYQTLRNNMLETSLIGDIIGYDKLRAELVDLIALVDLQKKQSKK